MTRGPESPAALDLRERADAVQLLEEIADNGERYALLALPESVVADLRWHGLDSPVISVLSRFAREAFTAEFPAAGQVITVVAAATSGDHPSDAPRSDLHVGDDGWGLAVSDAEAEALERENLRLQVEQRREQLANSFTRAEAAALLGVSAQTVSDMVAEHRLVGLKDGRSWRLPAWQFTPDLAEPVLPEVGRLAQEFPGGVVSLSRWMSRPNDNFDGRTPAQEMTRDSDRVIAVIRSLTAA